MKKILYLFVFCTFLVGCGSESGEVETSGEANNNSEKQADAQKESQVEKTEKETMFISEDEQVTVEDFAEITLKSTSFSKVIEPPNPGDFYSYYEAKDEGTTYLDTVIEIKSLLSAGKGADEFLSVKVVFDDNYEYQTFSTIEEKGGSDLTYTNITSIEPLKVGTLHFLAEIPDEVENSQESLVAIITINDEEFQHKIR